MLKQIKRGRGRPPVPTPCRWCHKSYMATKVREHEAACRKRPRNGKAKRNG